MGSNDWIKLYGRALAWIKLYGRAMTLIKLSNDVD